MYSRIAVPRSPSRTFTVYVFPMELMLQDHPYEPFLCVFAQWNCCRKTTLTSPYCECNCIGIAVTRPHLRALTVRVTAMELLSQGHTYKPLLCVYVQRNCCSKTTLTNLYCVCISNGIALQDHPYETLLCVYAHWNYCRKTTLTSSYCACMHSGIAVAIPPLPALTVHMFTVELLLQDHPNNEFFIYSFLLLRWSDPY